MSAIKKEELEELEKKYGLEAGDLTYQLRCSRITAYQKGEGETWAPPEKPKGPTEMPIQKSKWYGKKIIITPMMKPDAKRNLAYDEFVGYEMEVDEVNAGEQIYGAAEDVDRMVGDYKIGRIHKDRPVYAKTTFPKIGTEISYTPGKDLVPVVRGNDGQVGYIWIMPTSTFQLDEETVMQVFGLKTLIEQIYPELLPKFSGKPRMKFIDAVTLAADIPLTEALLKEHRRKELQDKRLGLV